MAKHFSWQQAVLESGISSGAKLTLMVVGSFMNQHGTGSWPSMSTVASLASLSRSSVKRHLAEAESSGWIGIRRRSKDNGEKDTNLYEIRFPSECRSTIDLCGVTMDPPRSTMNQPVGSQRAINTPVLTPHLTPQEPLMSGKPDDADSPAGILSFLNEQAGREFQPVKANLDKIASRLKEGFTAETIRDVIRLKVKEWKGTKFEQYLRPETLFGATKFAGYAGQRGMILRDGENGSAPGGKFDPVAYVNRHRKDGV